MSDRHIESIARVQTIQAVDLVGRDADGTLAGRDAANDPLARAAWQEVRFREYVTGSLVVIEDATDHLTDVGQHLGRHRSRR